MQKCQLILRVLSNKDFSTEQKIEVLKIIKNQLFFTDAMSRSGDEPGE